MAIWDKPARAGGLGGSATQTFSANSVKCPNCGSNLIFDPIRGECICNNCGGVFDPDTLDKVGAFGFVNPERDYDGTIEISKEDAERVEIVCNSCGAQIVTDKNTASTFCASLKMLRTQHLEKRLIMPKVFKVVTTIYSSSINRMPYGGV